MLPRLIEPAAVITRLARTLSPAQLARLDAVVDDISTEIRSATGRTWTLPDGILDPARPDLLAIIAGRAAERAMRNPGGLAAETVGDYSRRFPDHDTGDVGLYLSDGERRMLEAMTGAGTGLVSVPTVRDVVVDERRWLFDGHGGDLILHEDRPA
ncbi:hypothetical protein Val02_69130 [Virgisporangium aliadipatigenens]|uniref:Uncharacterized protein n=1 Tax=Virgisporangium aliadipatigenens TaxID=741659 RepID=A0A8J3YSX6_9ACTN|nr:hypothetical protein [Virgisporangium aliadipatigenens]GIJ50027.1 hypothetical protein Val02_69130 [Virgisporangium aliadipatigenens]